MSKQELQKKAYDHSGVTYEQSQKALNLQPSIYERIGKEEGFRQLSTLFYNRIFTDKSPSSTWFLNIFSSSTRGEAIENQYRFLVQTFGGPKLYQEIKGKYTRLVGRHANYPIGNRAAIQWVEQMIKAMEDHEVIREDEEMMQALTDYFQYTAHYIVAGMEYMRPDQVRILWNMS